MQELKHPKPETTFSVQVVQGLFVSAAVLLDLLLFLFMTVVKLHQHVNQFIGCLLHERALNVESPGLFDAQVLLKHGSTAEVCKKVSSLQ